MKRYFSMESLISGTELIKPVPTRNFLFDL